MDASIRLLFAFWYQRAIFSFPNVFTPNEDGSNDQFLATTVGVKELKVVIWDRWGTDLRMVCGKRNVNTTGWNGKTTKGKSLQTCIAGLPR